MLSEDRAFGNWLDWFRWLGWLLGLNHNGFIQRDRERAEEECAASLFPVSPSLHMCSALIRCQVNGVILSWTVETSKTANQNKPSSLLRRSFQVSLVKIMKGRLTQLDKFHSVFWVPKTNPLA